MTPTPPSHPPGRRAPLIGPRWRRPALLVLLAVLVLPLGLGRPGPARANGTDGKVAGMVVSHLGQTESDSTAMGRVRQDGVNTVSLFVWWWTDSPTSTTIRPYSGTESDADLVSQIDAAHANGMKVILVPIFYCGSCDGGWRGVMNPSDVPTFFASYRSFIDHYAQLAEANNVWLLFVGSEMTDLEGQTAQWQAVISSARSSYSGLIGYEQNWDVVARPQFLSSVDVVGVSAYFPLDDAADPPVSQLVSDWSDSRASAYQGRNWVGDLTHLANITGKPILFGEVGYMDSIYAGKQPFLNAYEGDDPQLQANLYQALLQTFSGYSWWMGVSWWEWSDSPGDVHRTPMGKPAETLLQKWYAQGWRPSSGSAASSAPSTTTPSAPSLPTVHAGVPGLPALGTTPAGAGTAGSAASPGATASPSADPGAAPSATTGGGPGSSRPGTAAGVVTGGSAAGAADPGALRGRHGTAEASGRIVADASAASGDAHGPDAVNTWGVVALLLLVATAGAVPLLALPSLPAWRRFTGVRREAVGRSLARRELAWAEQASRTRSR